MILGFVFLLFVKLDALARAESSQGIDLLKKVEAKYSISKTTHMSVRKTVTTSLLKKTIKTDGEIWLSPPSRLRAEFGKDQLIVLGKKKIWVVQRPTDPEFDSKTRVMTSNNPNKLESPLLTAFLIGKSSLLSRFKIKDYALNKSFPPTHRYTLVPKERSEDIEILELVIGDNLEIQSLTITDALKNETVLEVDKTEFGKKVPANHFTYAIPKGAEVTEF
ncbi:MAG: outer membrane lipoprotein carrier protein LolA [Bdellovibrionales bacterium]|nr:outer membrane lipoprotein carrier protein LolA [Bdellovibrionales bacterium]